MNNKGILETIALAICLCVIGIWFLSTDECKVTDDLSIITDGAMGKDALTDETRGTEPPSFEDLLDAIEWVESGGDASAVGDNGNAIGSFQIWKIYVDDLNRIGRAKHTDKYSTFQPWRYDDRKNRVLSRIMVREYLQHYATPARLGHNLAFEDMARIHNGGPQGHKKESTLKYWVKVKERLEQ